MGFLKAGLKQDEPDENESLEEQYEKLFPKIGRDFVHVDDLKRVLLQLSRALGTTGIHYQDTEARKRAEEYKSLLDSGQSGSSIYVDLIDMDE